MPGPPAPPLDPHLIIRQNVAENCMKMKEIGLERETRIQSTPVGFALYSSLQFPRMYVFDYNGAPDTHSQPELPSTLQCRE